MPLRKLSRGKHEVHFIKLRQDIELSDKVKEKAAILSKKNDSIVLIEKKYLELQSNINNLEKIENNLEKKITIGINALKNIEISREDTVSKYLKIKKEYVSILEDINIYKKIKSDIYAKNIEENAKLNKIINSKEFFIKELNNKIKQINSEFYFLENDIRELKLSKKMLEEDILKLEKIIKDKDVELMNKDVRIEQLTLEMLSLMKKKDSVKKHYK